jgi:hypothetical protein
MATTYTVDGGPSGYLNDGSVGQHLFGIRGQQARARPPHPNRRNDQSAQPAPTPQPTTSTPYGQQTGASVLAAGQSTAPSTLPPMTSFPTTNGGIPNYGQIADYQSQYNQNNALFQSNLNNPNYYGPGGSQIRVRNPDGTYSVVQSLSPQLQQNYDAQNALQGKLLGNASNLAANQLNFNNAPNAPTFDTSGVPKLPTPDANDLNTVRDSVYQQQTQYLDPQFQQAQSDLENKLANQGIMPGSEAYNREMNNFALQKQKAYGDARNSAIQAGGQEQSRLFGIGLNANQAGMNNAVTGFNAGMQSRQQGVSEAQTLHNSPLNDLSVLRSGPQVSLPNYPGMVGTSVPGVDYMNAANLGYNAQLAKQNADNAQSSNFTNGLFGLGSAAIQGGALNGLFGSNGTYGNWLSNNSNWMNNNNMTPGDTQTAF